VGVGIGLRAWEIVTQQDREAASLLLQVGGLIACGRKCTTRLFRRRLLTFMSLADTLMKLDNAAGVSTSAELIRGLVYRSV
jgi:hypothetical protein